MQRDQRHSDHYEWFSDFLDARGVAMYVRAGLAAIGLLMAVSSVILALGAGGPTTQPYVAMMWTAAAGGVAGAALWVRRWPTRRQSAAFAAVTTCSITLACLAYPDPLAALLGCITFMTIGAYLAFFHSTRSVLCVVALAVVVASVHAVELAMAGRPALAAVDLFIVVQANLAMPLAIHSLLRALRGDLVHALSDANHDPLTGLLNRRAFRTQTLNLFERGGDGHHLVVALIDLDKFKALNDTHGHHVGDQALVAVADALRATATSSAVISRSGGEEFLIADVAPADEALARYQGLCDAVAALHIPVTASVGTATAALDVVSDHDPDGVVDHLIAAADMAMYRAKRNGGNQCHHHGSWPTLGSPP